jgi:hypothetical protein
MPPATRTFHCHAEKRWAKEVVRELGSGAIGRPDLTIDQALAAIDALPSQYVPVGECDNRSPDGVCLGHDTRELERERRRRR